MLPLVFAETGLTAGEAPGAATNCEFPIPTGA